MAVDSSFSDVYVLPCRKQESTSILQHQHSPGCHQVYQDDSAKLCMHEEQTNKDERLQQHGNHSLDDARKGPASNSVRQEEQCSATAQQKKKRYASQTDKGTAVCQEAAGIMQTVSEAISGVGCKASKRQRPDNRAKASDKSCRQPEADSGDMNL